MSKNKNITLDKLADMMESGFEHLSGRIDAVEGKVNDVEKSMVTKTEMNKRFDGLRGEMNRRFDGLEDRVLASHQKRIEKLEAEVKELRAMFAA
jgi:predicted nuclease with TOPRIM domain